MRRSDLSATTHRGVPAPPHHRSSPGKPRSYRRMRTDAAGPAPLVKLVANSYNSTHGQWAFPHTGVVSCVYVVVRRAPQDPGFYQRRCLGRAGRAAGLARRRRFSRGCSPGRPEPCFTINCANASNCWPASVTAVSKNVSRIRNNASTACAVSLPTPIRSPVRNSTAIPQPLLLRTQAYSLRAVGSP